MADYVPTSEILRASLFFAFKLKKSAAESHRMLVEAYGEYALSKSQCERWFKRFKSGNFDLSNEERGRPQKKFEDADLQALLDEDGAQTHHQLAEALQVTPQAISLRLKSMGKITMGEEKGHTDFAA